MVSESKTRFTEAQRYLDQLEINRRFPIERHDKWNTFVNLINDGVGLLLFILVIFAVMFAFLVWGS